jgi:8-oxo-dGTP pyrophosphatase MutT (NUDIX family)
MSNETKKQATRASVTDLLLADYSHLSESFWKNEQVGETRVNFFIAIVTAALGSLAALLNTNNGTKGLMFRPIVIAGTLALLILGLLTLARLFIRNRASEEYKRGLDGVRQTFKDYCDTEGSLVGYYPIKTPADKRDDEPHKSELRKPGGLTHVIAGINALVSGACVAAIVYQPTAEAKSIARSPTGVIVWAFIAILLVFWTQYAWARHRDTVTKRELCDSAYTHAFGLVFKLEDGTAKYLLVRPKDGGNLWVLPKGHIEKYEGHGEAALREVYEETGVRARMIGCVGTVSYTTTKEHVRGKGYLLEFICQGTAKEARCPHWFCLEDLGETHVPEETLFLLMVAAVRRAALA